MATQWHRIFDEALQRADVVPVVQAAADHLGREATRSEMSAARRAASSYAGSSNVRAVRVEGITGSGRRTRFLVLARADADLDDDKRLEAIASGTRPEPGRTSVRNEKQITEKLITAVARSAKTARLVDPGRIDRDDAATMARELTVMLDELLRLRDRLERRGTGLVTRT